MELSKIIELQRDFDKQHKSNFKWSEGISQSNLEMLQFLTIALMGEAGEFSNIIKKIIRGDKLLDQSLQEISSELADIFIYTIKLSYQLDIDLEKAFIDKLSENELRFEKYKKWRR